MGSPGRMIRSVYRYCPFRLAPNRDELSPLGRRASPYQTLCNEAVTSAPTGFTRISPVPSFRRKKPTLVSFSTVDQLVRSWPLELRVCSLFSIL